MSCCKFWIYWMHGCTYKIYNMTIFLLLSYRSYEINKLTMDRYLLKSVLSFIHSPNGFHNVEDLNIWYCYKCEWIVSSTISSDIVEDTEKTEMREFFRQFKLAEMCSRKSTFQNRYLLKEEIRNYWQTVCYTRQLSNNLYLTISSRGISRVMPNALANAKYRFCDYGAKK